VELLAHSENRERKVHLLADHLREAEQLARQFGSRFACSELAALAARYHDIGKASPAFQEYIRDPDSAKRGSVRHYAAGAVLAEQRKLALLAFAIAGHHAGLDNKEGLRQKLLRESTEASKTLVAADRQGLIPSPEANLSLPAWLLEGDKNQCLRRAELWIRMVFSCLVDADFLSTEQHFNPQSAAARGAVPDLADLWRVFEARQASFMECADKRGINQIRVEMYGACLRTASSPPGVFRLTMPTGGGKTRAGMGFALNHAVNHGLDRVIFAIPYTSIIDQTADVYRGIFGDAAVLEHHSAIDPDRLSPDEERSGLASQNWDARIIVTTTVQLFESLFSNRPGRCRKLHNIARSVIVLDEVQTLPVHLLEPTLDVLQELVDHYGCTTVLCTATQPALDTQSKYLKGLRDVRDIVPAAEQYFQTLKRVDYDIRRQPWSWEQVAHAMREHAQCLAVVNARKDAVALYHALDDPATLHLSTLMCPVHRREVLAEIRERLAAKRPCRVISTQVIEAGVDVDFPVVFRAMGPLDRIVQAAGRCNREGRLAQPGKVIVFRPEEGGGPRGAYRTATEEAEMLLDRESTDLNDPRVFAEYFSRLYMDVSTDSKHIQSERAALNFATVAERYRLIEKNTSPVLIGYGDSHDMLAHAEIEYRVNKFVSRRTWQRLQVYLVNVYEHELVRYRNDGLATPHPFLGFDVWHASYDSALGITERAMDPADLVT